jgi:hypothetical protein
VKIELKPEEIQIASEIWKDLKQGVIGAHDKLIETPDNIRDAILGALVFAMDTRTTTDNPFD